MPTAVDAWYNVVADLPVAPPPPRNSEGGRELQRFGAIVPKGLQYLATSKKRWHPIPTEVLSIYRSFGRPTPLMRAERLERHLRTPARIYLKREDVVPSGSFKLNTAVAQVVRAAGEGYEGVVTETGAGQWGLALSIASAMCGLRCRIFMARCSYEQKEGRRKLMGLYGAEVFASPSGATRAGAKMAADSRFHAGSIGTAISEAVEYADQNRSWAYVAGSNLPFVYVHQSIMGLETAQQLAELGEVPGEVYACVGGGSNFAGFALPLAYGPHAQASRPKLVACESSVIPRLTRGVYEYDHGDPAGLTPLVKSFSLGRDFTPPPTHVGGLRQHNGSAVIGALHNEGLIDAIAFDEATIFEAGRMLAATEGILPAPESAHALAGVIARARAAASAKEELVVTSCISGSGILDLAGYESQASRLQAVELSRTA